MRNVVTARSLRRALTVATVAVCALLGVSVGNQAAASPAATADSHGDSVQYIGYNVYSRSSQFCWDVASYNRGTPVGIYTCHWEDSYLSQKWYLYYDGSGYANIISEGSGDYQLMCLDLGSTVAGSPVVLAPCHFETGYWSQKWQFSSTTENLFNAAAGRCMDLGSNNIGSTVVIAPCVFDLDYRSQQWGWY